MVKDFIDVLEDIEVTWRGNNLLAHLVSDQNFQNLFAVSRAIRGEKVDIIKHFLGMESINFQDSDNVKTVFSNYTFHDF